MLVKKYGNRRLYDTEESRYITLEDLAAHIQSGEDVEVVDAKTGQDLTQATLAQIILESRGAARLLPVPLLKQLIRMGDDALAEFLGRYMSWTLEIYLQVRQGAQAVAPLPLNLTLNPLATLSFLAQNPLARFFTGGLPWTAPPASPSRPAPNAPSAEAKDAGPSPDSPVEEEIADLRREIEQLKRAMGRRKRE